jgi:hypothetical protein
MSPEASGMGSNRYTEEARIAAALRDQVPRGRAVLFHGTVYPATILRENRLRHPDFASEAIHFSRALHVAVYWGRLGRDDDEMQGAVFVIDRERLAQNYKLVLDCSVPGKARGDFEAEEMIVARDVIDLDRYLARVIWLPPHLYRPDPRRKRNERREAGGPRAKMVTM